MYRYELGKFDVDSIVSFAKGWYKNVKRENVPRELTWFDNVTDDIVKFLKVNIKITASLLFSFSKFIKNKMKIAFNLKFFSL